MQVTDAAITALNTISTSQGSPAAPFTTNASVITKMYVTQIDFPYCNIYTPKSLTSDITVKLKVENAALISESVKFDRSFRVDYVILEPAQ